MTSTKKIPDEHKTNRCASPHPHPFPRAIPTANSLPRVGHWLPQDSRIHRAWLAKAIAHVDQNPKALHPVLQDFKKAIENSTRLTMLFSSMFDEIPKKKPYTNDPNGNPEIRDYGHMCEVLNHLISTAPSWSDHSHDIGLVGVPMNALFDWPMGTPSGWAVFLDPEVNGWIKKILNAWGEYLDSPESAAVLGDDANGWFGPTGYKSLLKVANVGPPGQAQGQGTQPDREFEDLFICDPKAKNHGYKSWDEFFTRHFREGVRPIASPDDDLVIANPCESTPYRTAHNVSKRDKFWVKGQPYSVADMLASDPLASHFVGGTIYQAFLSALSYHRWHSPVTGKIKKVKHIQGTYFSEPLFEGFANPSGADPTGQGPGQAYISAVATRVAIFIEADNSDLGLVCVLQIGMVEVSSCDVTVEEGQHVKKGDEIGMVSPLPPSAVLFEVRVDHG
jgi:phosphatidylserine decarboxylase